MSCLQPGAQDLELAIGRIVGLQRGDRISVRRGQRGECELETRWNRPAPMVKLTLKHS